MTLFTFKAHLLKNLSVNFFEILANERPWWPPTIVQTPFWLNHSMWVKLTKN